MSGWFRRRYLDLLGSIVIHNIRAMVGAGLENMDLTRYLVGQAMLSVPLQMCYPPGGMRFASTSGLIQVPFFLSR